MTLLIFLNFLVMMSGGDDFIFVIALLFFFFLTILDALHCMDLCICGCIIFITRHTY